MNRVYKINSALSLKEKSAALQLIRDEGGRVYNAINININYWVLPDTVGRILLEMKAVINTNIKP